MTKRMTPENSVSEFSITHNFGTKTVEEKSSNPVLTQAYGQEYTYKFLKNIDCEKLGIPYPFIIATLKQFVRYDDNNRSKIKKGQCERVLLVARSEKGEFALSLLIEMSNSLINIFSVQKYSVSDFDNRTIKANLPIKKVYLDDLDLDTYVEKIKEGQKQWRNQIATKYPSFWTDESNGLDYNFFCTRHLSEKRTHSSGKRLTIPVEAIKDILRYTMETSAPALKEYIGTSSKEKQVVIVIPSIDKKYSVSLLVAVDDILFTVISMYDVSPKSRNRGMETLMFPNVKRIILPDYDLGAYMEIYNEQVKVQKKDRQEKRKQAIEEARRSSSIKIISSLDDYFVPKVKTVSAKPEVRKIRVVRSASKNIQKDIIEKKVLQSSENIELQPSKKIIFFDLLKSFFLKLFGGKDGI